MAPAGNVTSQDTKIVPTTFRLSAAMPLARPTPRTPPTSVCVVDTGRLYPEAITTVVAAAISAANPLLGVSSVMWVPIVLITR